MTRTIAHPVPGPSGPLGKLLTPTHVVKRVGVALSAGPAVVTRNDFFHLLLDAIEAPHSDHNARALVAWAVAEGGRAWWNPLNTTRYEPGSWDYNFAHVKDYPSETLGVAAEAQTLKQTAGVGNFSAILGHLRANATAKQTLQAVENSNWGTGGLALRVLPQVQRDYWAYAGVHVAPT